jgi:hypothetical protein
LPILAHRNVRHIFPQLHLQFGTNPPLLIDAAGVEPGGAQRFDAQARRPAIPGGESVRSNYKVAIRVDVRDRSVEKPKECVPAALAPWRRDAGPNWDLWVGCARDDCGIKVVAAESFDVTPGPPDDADGDGLLIRTRAKRTSCGSR